MIPSDLLIADRGNTLILESYSRITLRAGLYIIDHLAVHGVDDYTSAQSCHRVGNVHCGENIVILTHELRMGFYDHLHKKIPSGSSVHAGLTLITDPDALSVIDTCRNGYLDGLLAADITCAAAVRALVLDDLSASSAVRACLHIPNSAEE